MVLNIKLFGVLIFVALTVLSCEDKTPADTVPKINILQLSSNSMLQGSLNNDSIIVTLSFVDQDGDLGGQNEPNIFVIDNRNNDIYDTYSLPRFPVRNKPTIGEIDLRLFNTCCIFPDGIFPCSSPSNFPINEMTLDIYIVDNAGNRSNKVTTPTITLRCN